MQGLCLRRRLVWKLGTHVSRRGCARRPLPLPLAPVAAARHTRQHVEVSCSEKMLGKAGECLQELPGCVAARSWYSPKQSTAMHAVLLVGSLLYCCTRRPHAAARATKMAPSVTAMAVTVRVQLGEPCAAAEGVGLLSPGPSHALWCVVRYAGHWKGLDAFT